MAAASRPFASAGFDGATTFRPGTAIPQFSRLCECWAPKRVPPPLAVRMANGNEARPAAMHGVFATWVATISQQGATKAENMITTDRRTPVQAAPVADPDI